MASPPNKKTQKPPAGVVKTLVALSEACGFTSRSLQAWKKMAGFPVRADGLYSVWEVSAWYWSVGPGAAKRAMEVDPEMIGEAVDSPALERYRAARAEMVEIDLKLRKKELLDRETVHQLMGVVAAFIREFGEQLQRDGHRAVFDDWESMLLNVEEAIQKYFSQSQSESEWECQAGEYHVSVKKVNAS